MVNLKLLNRRRSIQNFIFVSVCLLLGMQFQSIFSYAVNQTFLGDWLEGFQRLKKKVDISSNNVKEVLQSPSEDNRTLLIISTYHRSGSSLLGDIFNNHPDVMYFYEPLIIIKEFRRNDVTPFRVRQHPYKNKTISHAINVIRNLARCNYTDVAFMNRNWKKLGWVNWFKFLARSRKLASAFNCDHEVETVRITKCGPSITSMTEEMLNQVCTKHKFRVIKTTRLHIEDLLPLLEQHFTTKIIYLIRDPRAVFASRKTLGFGKVNSTVKELCADMLQNFRTAMLMQIPKSVLLIVRYEELVRNFEDVTKKIINFVGLSYSHHITEFLEKVAHGQERSFNDSLFEIYSKQLSTLRKNPESHINKWKKILSKDEIKLIEAECGEYMQILDYSLSS